MKLYQKVGLIIFFCLCIRFCSGQELTPGNTCPDVELVNYANNEEKSFRLSEIKAKLIIFDFWGTGCTSCVQAFQKIDSLQKKFGSDVQFILVNRETADSTRKFFSKRKKIKVPDVPLVMGDSVLHKLFPHVFVPHHVWLDSHRDVHYITDGHNATAKNINDFLLGKEPQLSFKKDIAEFDDLQMRAIPNWKENIVYYSSLAHHVSGLALNNGISSTAGNVEPNHIACTSSSISQLFQRAFAEGNKYNFDPANTLILNVKNRWRFTFPDNKDEYGEWYKSNLYYYELIVPPAKADDLYKIMQKDLMRHFDVDVRVEKRRIKCLLFKSIGSLEKLKTKGGKSRSNFYYLTEDSIRYMYNMPFEGLNSVVVRLPIGTGLESPVISLVKFKGNIDFEMPKASGDNIHDDVNNLRAALKKYNLDLVEEYYMTDVLVIRDKK